MLVKWLAWLSGYVTVEITGTSPERFMNLCAFQQKDVWGFCAVPKGLMAYVKVSEYKSLRGLAKKAGCRLHITAKKGLPFLVRQYRYRWGLIIGVLVFSLMLTFLGSRLWRIEVNGNVALETREILSILAEEGICEGIGKNQFEWATVRQSILAAHPEIAWMSMNPDGAVLYIDISETTKAPDLPDDSEPSNIKADIDGRIVEIRANVGQPMVQVGDGVVKGDILISGAVEYANGCTVFRHASGTVIAETVHKKTFTVPLNQTQLQPGGKQTVRRVLHCFGLKIPLYLGSVQGEYEKHQQERWLTVQGVPLPLGISTATFYHLEPQSVTYTSQQAEALALTMAEEYGQDSLSEAEITDISYESKVEKGALSLQVKFFCVEDITFEEKMLIFQ